MNRVTWIWVVAITLAVTSSQTFGGVKFKNEDGDYMKLGGRIQLQYHREDPDGGESSDSLFFRRFRPYIEGSVHEDWKGKFQWDMGKSKIAIKDAYMAYTGLGFCDVMVGNANFPFSRELLTSSKKQQLVERTFVGDHNYGTPDRQTGVHLVGAFGEDDMITWGLSAAKGAVDPSNSKLDFDTVIQIDAGDDWSEGEMIGGRVDFHPFGKLKMEQGDFKRDVKATIGAAAFMWGNDNDNLDPEREDDVDSVTGIEISAAFRGAGFSFDAEYNTFNSELVDAGITDGLYQNSETTLDNYALEGGYMVIPSRVELVAGYQSQDADGYSTSWNRTSVGANFFVAKHDIKYQVTYQMGENKDGETGHDVDEVFVQAQYVF
jgi:hypothetical protein